MKVTRGPKVLGSKIISDFVVSGHKNEYDIPDAPYDK